MTNNLFHIIYLLRNRDVISKRIFDEVKNQRCNEIKLMIIPLKEKK